ncbi:hypothetical protein SBF1_4700003 [Candidatus Desulfosporosinus infrequens]|uniref:Uncharacterized protein n=1 Tax=Candidatus Desulfosporosinus infrequens TaxID=2043169 RepID=A0A2U3LF15_9FIRM|nr:hypothetical protein SBF1_4700003 [Candidatus Desulfosporosinus infrequens]
MKDGQICGDIQKQERAHLRANMPSQGSCSVKIAVRSFEGHLGAQGKISSTYGVV